MIIHRHFQPFITVLITIICGTFLSCRKEVANVPSESEEIAEKVFLHAQSHPNGFTVHVPDMSVPIVGIVVAYEATQSSFNKGNLVVVVDHALLHDNIVGGWLDVRDSCYYYDSCRLFPEDSIERAINFGLANHQKAIFILSRDSSIYL